MTGQPSRFYSSLYISSLTPLLERLWEIGSSTFGFVSLFIFLMSWVLAPAIVFIRAKPLRPDHSWLSHRVHTGLRLSAPDEVLPTS
jgi:hypothetical protein